MRALTNALIMVVIGSILFPAYSFVVDSITVQLLPQLSDYSATVAANLIRASNVLAALLIAVLIAFPTGLLLGCRLQLWGALLAVPGLFWIVLFDPKGALPMFLEMRIEFSALLLCSGLMYYWGLRIRQRAGLPKQSA